MRRHGDSRGLTRPPAGRGHCRLPAWAYLPASDSGPAREGQGRPVTGDAWSSGARLPQLPLPTASLRAPWLLPCASPGPSPVGHPSPSPVGHPAPPPWGTPAPSPWGAPSLPRGAPRTPPWVFAAVTPEAAGSVEPGPCSRRWPCLRSDELTWAEPRSVGGRRGLRSRTGVATQPAPWWGRDSHSEPHAHTRELRLPGFTLC